MASAITRGNSGGLYNVAVEEFFTNNSSPTGTRWAFKSNNPGEGGNPGPTVTASNAAMLTFNDWQTALGGTGVLATNILDGAAVLHLVAQDIYLDIRFTAWGTTSAVGGSFSYERAEITPSADFDRDGDVDGQDFLTWQRGYGVAESLQPQGDANFDGTVDGGDLEVWQETYGSPLAAIRAVPEPSGFLLGILSASGPTALFRRRIRG